MIIQLVMQLSMDVLIEVATVTKKKVNVANSMATNFSQTSIAKPYKITVITYYNIIY